MVIYYTLIANYCVVGGISFLSPFEDATKSFLLSMTFIFFFYYFTLFMGKLSSNRGYSELFPVLKGETLIRRIGM